MALLYRLLGMTAAVNSVLGAIRLHHIPLNWLAMAALAVAGAVQAVGFGPDRAGGVFADPQAGPISKVVLCALILVLLAICLVERNVIFRRTDSVGGGGTLAVADAKGRDPFVAPRASGYFRRRSGGTLWLHDVPTAWEISEEGAISLVTRVDGEGFHGFLGLPEDPSGTWSLALSRELLQNGLADGILYYGLSARPALRGVSPGTGKDIILSLDSVADLLAFRRTLDEILAESARREATFFREVEQAQAAAPAPEPGKRSAPAGNSGDRVAWENLIDFAR